MKNKIYTILLSTLLFSFFSCGNSENKTNADSAAAKNATVDSPDAVAQKMVDAISTNDYDKFSSLVISKDEMLAVINHSGASMQAKSEKLKELDNDYAKMVSVAKTGFNETRAAGEKDGLVWKDVKFKKSDVAMNTGNGMEGMILTGFIDFKGAEYPLFKGAFAKTENGWKLAGDLKFGGGTDPKAKKKDWREEQLVYNKLIIERDLAKKDALDCQSARDRAFGASAKDKACNDLQAKMNTWAALEKKATEEKAILDAMPKD
jgi:hypothetical protein